MEQEEVTCVGHLYLPALSWNILSHLRIRPEDFQGLYQKTASSLAYSYALFEGIKQQVPCTKAGFKNLTFFCSLVSTRYLGLWIQQLNRHIFFNGKMWLDGVKWFGSHFSSIYMPVSLLMHVYIECVLCVWHCVKLFTFNLHRDPVREV